MLGQGLNQNPSRDSWGLTYLAEGKRGGQGNGDIRGQWESFDDDHRPLFPSLLICIVPKGQTLSDNDDTQNSFVVGHGETLPGFLLGTGGMGSDVLHCPPSILYQRLSW